MNLVSIKQRIPTQIKSRVRFLANLSLDTIEFLVGRRDPLTPPRRSNFVGDGDFRKIGEEFFRYFVDLGGLRSEDTVLDVGCGIGRMAVPLTRYLSSTAFYEGIDIVQKGTDWCTNHISSGHPNFRFTFSNVFNATYNPVGKIRASQYSFPFRDESFDFVFLTSVFTHMLPEDLKHYLSEIARVMRTGGRCLITFFLLNAESLRLIEENKSSQSFRPAIDDFRISNPKRPEDAVAYDEKFIHGLFSKHGLSIREPVYYGSWCGRQDYLSFQDIIVATKS